MGKIHLPSGVTQARVVLFDLGGVLLPFDRERRIAAMVGALGVTADAAWALMAGDLPTRMDSGAADGAELAAAFTALAGRSVPPSEASDLILSVFEAPNLVLWDLAARLSERVTVGGFSDNPGFVRQVFPSGARLDPMIFSSEIGACKPSAEAFAKAEEIVSAAPPEILFIDDSPGNVAAALARGWDAILFVSNEQLTRDLKLRGLP
jgi:FMN phosphatase YigB (HAD superfamily)